MNQPTQFDGSLQSDRLDLLRGQEVARITSLIQRTANTLKEAYDSQIDTQALLRLKDLLTEQHLQLHRISGIATLLDVVYPIYGED